MWTILERKYLQSTLARFGLACSNFFMKQSLPVQLTLCRQHCFMAELYPATNCDTLWGWFFGGDTWSHILWNAGSIVLWQSSTQLQIATHCGTLVECPHLKRTKTMLFHSFFFEPFPFCGTLVECPHLKRTKTMHFHSFFFEPFHSGMPPPKTD